MKAEFLVYKSKALAYPSPCLQYKMLLHAISSSMLQIIVLYDILDGKQYVTFYLLWKQNVTVIQNFSSGKAKLLNTLIK